MTAENFDAILRIHLSRQPFQIFTIELHGGTKYEIDGPLVLGYRDGVAAFLAPGGIPAWFDHDSVLQIMTAAADSAA